MNVTSAEVAQTEIKNKSNNHPFVQNGVNTVFKEVNKAISEDYGGVYISSIIPANRNRYTKYIIQQIEEEYGKKGYKVRNDNFIRGRGDFYKNYIEIIWDENIEVKRVVTESIYEAILVFLLTVVIMGITVAFLGVQGIIAWPFIIIAGIVIGKRLTINRL